MAATYASEVATYTAEAVTDTATFPTPSLGFIPPLTPPPGTAIGKKEPLSLVTHAQYEYGFWLITATVFFLLRTYVRAYVKRQFILEDYLVSLTWMCVVIYIALGYISMAAGAGQHVWNLTMDEESKLFLLLYFQSIHYCSTTTCVKIAILLLYRRIFTTPQHRLKTPFDITILALIATITTYYVIIGFMTAFQCIPPDAVWKPETGDAQCLPHFEVVLDITSVFNVLTDIVILVLPIRAVSKLQLNRMKKFKCIMVFTLGLCGPFFAIVATVIRAQVVQNPDLTAGLLIAPFHSCRELASSLICVCLPEVTPLFNRSLWSQLWGSRKNGTTVRANTSDGETRKSGDIKVFVTKTTTMTSSPMNTPGYIELGDLYQANVTTVARPETPGSKNDGDSGHRQPTTPGSSLQYTTRRVFNP
ncbi:hypothetical protein K491DRAFT_111966 [Lophiostoma macrostomum CBS 122681]|uniref:Rhodopsin domain-containing protein n=1 Tax=Lophiostoma macrostomum CBS 122681 TaxID=1314788 RepID=A0A6A6SX04_9PLEO|nr:hypothetical protein K491DRAFT_111966 [Lophiostoma macrostomum CBS 122681]